MISSPRLMARTMAFLAIAVMLLMATTFLIPAPPRIVVTLLALPVEVIVLASLGGHQTSSDRPATIQLGSQQSSVGTPRARPLGLFSAWSSLWWWGSRGGSTGAAEGGIMARVLLVEDDGLIADLVQLYLRHEAHEVEVVGDGVAALRLIEAHASTIDLVVLDLMLPGLDGRGICRRIREGAGGRPDLPVLLLTALDDDRDMLEGFRLGADDYLTKPFNPDELVARVAAILRRTSGRSVPTTRPDGGERAPGEVVVLGRARLDLAARLLLLGGQTVPLRTKEFDLLAALATRPGVVVGRDGLIDRVWGPLYQSESRTVDVHVSRLREKLAAATGLIIETVRGVGYRLVVGA